MDLQPSDLPLGFLINIVGDQIRQATEVALDGIELSVMELGVLWLVDLHPEQSQATYARFQRRDLTTFGRIVDRLETRGLMQRKPVETDRRAYQLSLSYEGRKILRRGKKQALLAEEKVFSVLGSDIESLREALIKTLGY